jgi:secreted trypsin-like serine protease
MAALLYNGVSNASLAQFCGGALISDRHILTAAHCVSLFKQNQIQVLLGETKLPFGKGDRLEISGFVIHPRFDGNTLEHDLAIIKLRKPVDIPPVKLALPSDAALYQPGTNAFTMGWGFKDANMPILPANLQQAEIPLVSDEVCVDELGRLFIPDSMMCAGKKATSSTSGDGVDSCIGDSGGPMVVSDGAGGWKLVGVVSWGLGSCANEKTRGVYAEVPVHEDFVTSFPDIAPYFTSTPFVSGDGTVGSAMVCNLGEMGGDPATSISYSWYRDGSIITDATSETYTVKVEDQGGYIGCSVSASNSAGSSNTEYSGTTLVPAAQIQEVTPTTTPTPTPGDTTPPQAAVTSFVCKSHKCFVTIAATDSESGVQDVSATVRFSYSATCAKKRGCTKTKAKQLKLRRGQLGSWAGNFRYAKRKAQKASIEIVARDAAGNATPVMAVASKSL